ncbi:MAG: hypothetical protein QXT63_09325 [Thermoplasmata archaeon]
MMAVESVAAVQKCFPWGEIDATIETEIGYEVDKVTYTVTITNNMPDMIKQVKILPSIPIDTFLLEEKSKLLGPIFPGESKSAVFKLTPVSELWEIGVSGKAIEGRDISIRTILRCNKGRVSYNVVIKNNRTYNMKNVKVKPFLPPEFTVDVKEKTIEILKPLESVELEFRVRPKSIHIRPLRMYGVGVPIRKNVHVPKPYTEEELANALKRKSERKEADLEYFFVEDEFLECDFDLAEGGGKLDEGLAEEAKVVIKPAEPIPEPKEFEGYEENPIEEELDIVVKPMGMQIKKVKDIEVEGLELEL